MARRPDDTRGSLVFQEGKEIEGDYYIIAVYDDPTTAVMSFSAYELENDSTFTYPLTYAEFDKLFQFDAELMNPSNQDARFHWVIERLDFVQDNRAQKVLCLAQEPTPMLEDEDEMVFAEDIPKAKEHVAVGGRVDAATRVKLLKELDNQDEERQQIVLVKSEAARRHFLADLHAKRQLEQLKASQRLLKTDEERESRLKKLELMKQAQKRKAEQFRANQEAKKNTMAQLEVLMKQKEAQAIRKLIQEKDEADRGMGRAKDADRQRRKMQERSQAEIASIETEKARQLGQKRDDQVKKREQVILRRNRQIATDVRSRLDEERKNEMRLRGVKDGMIAELWSTKKAERQEKEAKYQEFLRLEEVRERVSLEREKIRAAEEWDYIQQLRKHMDEVRLATEERRQEQHKAALTKLKVEASNRAVLKAQQQNQVELREQRIQVREEARSRRARETQFLTTVRHAVKDGGALEDAPASPKPALAALGDSAGPLASRSLMGPDSPLAKSMTRDGSELMDFHRTYEQQERQKRHAEREAKREAEEEKRGKLAHLASRDPAALERQRIAKMHAEQEQKKKAVEEAQLARELAVEAKAREESERSLRREELFNKLEVTRQERERNAEAQRTAALVERTQALEIGRGLPTVLSF